MQALAFYLAFPFIWLLSVLPFPVLFVLSDGLAFLIWLAGYRKRVILTNLRKSFPEKKEAEIRRLSRLYYRYLCDITLETFKMMRMSEEEVRKRIRLVNPEVAQKLFDQKKSIILALGHYGNWEWYGQCLSLEAPHQMVIIYKPLSNSYFDRMMQVQRTRFGTEITTMKLSMRTMLANKDRITATAFVGDQAAPVTEHWMTFLNQDSSVYTGIEKMAKKLNIPVVYLHPTRPRRGFYNLEIEIIVAEPLQTAEFEITETFTRRLERDIRDNPVLWLWSHKRWKIQRPTSAPGS